MGSSLADQDSSLGHMGVTLTQRKVRQRRQKDKSNQSSSYITDWFEKGSFTDMVEEKILKGYENDCKRIIIIHNKFDLDDVNCNKCQFKSHSQGLLKIHKREKHGTNETFENVIEGFKNDIEDHVRTLEAMCEDDKVIYRMRCQKCDFKNNSEGNLRMHKRDIHNQN